MSLLQKIALFLWFGSFAIVARAAHPDARLFDRQPDPLVVKIFHMLDADDLSRVGTVASRYRALIDNDIPMWSSLLERNCGEGTMALKPPTQNSREFFITFYPLHRLVKDILDMEHWPEEKILSLTSREKYAEQVHQLLKYQEICFIAKARALSIKNGGQLFVFYHVYNSHLTGVQLASEHMGRWDNYWCSAHEILDTVNDSWDDEIQTIFDEQYGSDASSDDESDDKGPPRLRGEEHFCKVMLCAARKVNQLPRIMALLEHKPFLWQSILDMHYILAYTGRDPEVNAMFHKAWNAGLYYFASIEKLNLSKKEVLQLIATHTWLVSEENAQNPYIASFKRIMEIAANE